MTQNSWCHRRNAGIVRPRRDRSSTLSREREAEVEDNGWEALRAINCIGRAGVTLSDLASPRLGSVASIAEGTPPGASQGTGPLKLVQAKDDRNSSRYKG